MRPDKEPKSEKEKKNGKAKYNAGRDLAGVIRRTQPGSVSRHNAVALYAYLTGKRARNVADKAHVLINAPQVLQDGETPIDDAQELIADIAHGLIDSIDETA
jgi:hypothetical protein